jgi:threonine/homoserine/homoserine lactone efflux protein
MTPSLALAFALAMLVQAAVPGPGVFTTLGRSVAGEMRSGLGVVGGIVLGDVIYALLAVFALSTAARFLGNVLVVVKLCGAAYLIWLGIRLWPRNPSLPSASPQSVRRSWAGGLATGLVTTLANPKAILFYGGFLPAFFDLPSFTIRDTLVLVSIVVIVLASVLSAYAILASTARGAFRSSRSAKRLNRLAGSVMIATGVVVAVRR